MAKKKKRRLSKAFITLLVILILLLTTVCSALLWYKISLQPTGTSQDEQTIEISDGQTKTEILDVLQERGIIKSALAASIYLKLHPENLYAGNYRINTGMDTPEILDYISNPENQELSYAVVTIPEGYWAKQIAEILANQFPQYTQQQFIDLWNDAEYIQTLSESYDFIDPSVLDNEQYFVKLEGYLFPDTYYIDYDMTPDEITRMFLDQFQIVYDEYKDEIENSGYTLQQILTLASIVQFESGNAAEMKDIAEVFYNRLEQSMKLQSSVTVCYALYDEFESAQDCETNYSVDSPYNTYEYEGIPIGPILNPGSEAIAAVLNPNKNDYLFFVSDIYGDGSIHYATTYEEHLANIEKYNLNIE